MNTDDILDALNEVDDTCIKNARTPKKKGHKALWISTGAVAAACLLVALRFSFSLRQTPPNKHIHHDGYCDCPDCQITPTPAIGQKSSLGIAYKNDFRQRNGSDLYSPESMITWPWEYIFICDQYPTVEYNDITYRSRTSYTGNAVSESWIGAKIADTAARGGYAPEPASYAYSMACELFEIKGISTDRFLAVKYEGHEEYYVFMQDTFNPPATLGDLITDLSLTETFPLTSLYYESECYSLSETDSDVLWELFLTHANCSTITTDFAEEQLSLGKNVMSFTINAEALGIYNNAWSLTSGGYLRTNIEDYGYYYNLGKDAVKEIMDFAESHKKAAPPKQEFTIMGEVTEITDTYIKVDDTVFMEHPEVGVEFTVELNDLRLQRYVACNRLQVGDYVLISHTGSDAANPTHIVTAYDLRIGYIDDTGTIYIKE